MAKRVRHAFDDTLDQITDQYSDYPVEDEDGRISIHTDSSDVTINPECGRSVTVNTDGDDIDVSLTRDVVEDLGSDVDSFVACDDHLASRRVSDAFFDNADAKIAIPLNESFEMKFLDSQGYDIENLDGEEYDEDPIDPEAETIFLLKDAARVDNLRVDYLGDENHLTGMTFIGKMSDLEHFYRREELEDVTGVSFDDSIIEDYRKSSRRFVTSSVVDAYGDQIRNGDVLHYTDESGRPSGQDARVIQIDDDSIIVSEDGDRYTLTQDEIDEYGLILDYPYGDGSLYASRRVSRGRHAVPDSGEFEIILDGDKPLRYLESAGYDTDEYWDADQDAIDSRITEDAMDAISDASSQYGLASYAGSDRMTFKGYVEDLERFYDDCLEDIQGETWEKFAYEERNLQTEEDRSSFRKTSSEWKPMFNEAGYSKEYDSESPLFTVYLKDGRWIIKNGDHEVGSYSSAEEARDAVDDLIDAWHEVDPSNSTWK